MMQGQTNVKSSLELNDDPLDDDTHWRHPQGELQQEQLDLLHAALARARYDRRLAQTPAAKNENNLFVKNRNPRSLCMKAGEAFTHIADAVGRDPAEMLKVIHCLHSRVGL